MIDREDILRKASALLRMTMANGCTEAEAATAAAKLQELAESYGIDMGELHEEQRRRRISDGMREIRVMVPWSRVPHSFVSLMTAIAAGFDCRSLTTPVDRRTCVLFIGFGPDADLAGYLFSILSRELPKEGSRLGRAMLLRRRRLTVFSHAFVIGCAWAIKTRLHERRRQATKSAAANSTALIRMSKAVVIDGYLKDRYRVKTQKPRKLRMSMLRRIGIISGMAHGQDVPLQTAIGA